MNKIISMFLCLLIFQIPSALGTEYAQIEQKIMHLQQHFPKGNLQNISYVKNIINEMYQLDQDIRQYAIKNQNDPKFIKLMHTMDNFHTSKMKEILLAHKWITISKFGDKYDNKAWLLVQHADDDPKFQASVLSILSNLMKIDETSKKNYAYLYDRVALKDPTFGMKQRYGTQVSIEKNGDIALLSYEGSLQDIDVRRKEVGLEPLDDYLEKIKEVFK